MYFFLALSHPPLSSRFRLVLHIYTQDDPTKAVHHWFFFASSTSKVKEKEKRASSSLSFNKILSFSHSLLCKKNLSDDVDKSHKSIILTPKALKENCVKKTEEKIVILASRDTKKSFLILFSFSLIIIFYSAFWAKMLKKFKTQVTRIRQVVFYNNALMWKYLKTIWGEHRLL